MTFYVLNGVSKSRKKSLANVESHSFNILRSVTFDNCVMCINDRSD